MFAKILIVRTLSLALLATVLISLAQAASGAELVVDDPLTNGSTIGVRDNGQGQFVSGGWIVTGASDNIRYTPPTPIEEGAVEFDVTGLRFDDTRSQNHRGQLMSMYDASFGDPRHRYAPDIRKNPFKFVLHRNGRDENAHFANYLKFIMNTDGVNQFEEYSAVGPFPWDEDTTYRMRLEWKDGLIRFFINGQDIDRWPFVYRSLYRPAIHDIRIGTNTRNNGILGALYSNVKIFDYGTAPEAPIINNPRPDAISRTLAPVIDWTGDRHSHYQVRITHSEDPETDIAWSSGSVTSSLHYAVSNPLSDQTTYYVHVRLRNEKGWGGWSSPQRFKTGTAETNRVPKHGEHEIVLLTSKEYSNPYTRVSLSATFIGPTQNIRVNGFWDGGKLYKIRVLPTEVGTWHWTTSSSDPELNNQSGTFVCEESSNQGYVRVSPSLPYTFEWTGDGAPFFLMGDTIWHMYYNLRFLDGSFQSLIDDRADQSFNYAHGVVHDFLHNEGGAIYREQDPDRRMFDVETLNPSYFHVIDKKIDYMNSRGMVAGLFFSWGNEGYQEYETSEQYQRYARYLVSRYASKNVFWIIVGEFEEASEPRSRWQDYMRTVFNNDPYKHPISIHTVATTNIFGSNKEHSFVSQQRSGSPEVLRQWIADSRIFDKPVVNLEYGYEGNPQVFANNQHPNDVRKDHYALTLAGGYGVYGNHTPWYSTYHRVGDFVLTATDTPGAQFLTILYDFFTQTNFQRLSPAQELVNNGICAAWPNIEYIVQLPSGGSVTVDLARANGSFDVDWFNPRSGERTPQGTTTGGGKRSFNAPDTKDWILHIYNYPLGGEGFVSVDLGSTDIEEGITNRQADDGKTTPETISGINARRNSDPSMDYYFYFAVSDGFAFEGSQPEAFISIDYYDTGSGTLTLQYDATDGSVHKDGGSVALTGSNTWKSHTFQVKDAFFGNRQNAGADFRVFGGTDKTFFLDVVRVSRLKPGPPSPPTSPSPAVQAMGISVSADLSWTAGLGATAHDLYFGTTDPPAFQARQTETTYDPGILSSETTYFWRIDEVNPEGTTRGPDWSFTTQGAPGPASNPSPVDGATGVSLTSSLSWTAGSEASSHDVHFGSNNPPPFMANANETSFDPGTLAPRSTYYWRVDEVNSVDTRTGTVWRFTTSDAVSVSTLKLKRANGIAIDGRPDDWDLAEFTSKVRAGEIVSGDRAVVGYDEGVLYTAGFATHLVLPVNEADHTATVYGRHDADSLYFLARLNDDDIQTAFDPSMNWANDCVEIYIDPSDDGGSTPLKSSTSDIQLVIDAANQKNVYMTTSGYRSQVLNGVTSAVSMEGSGWWLEVQILKSALDPHLPAEARFGLDFNFRDNDDNNNPNETTVYTWSDIEQSGAFPSKIPNRWGDALLPTLGEPSEPGQAHNPNPADGATEVSTNADLSWIAGSRASSHDVYFGTSNPPPFVIHQLETSFDPGSLEPFTSYTWRIDEVNGAGTTAGPVWSFITGPDVAVSTLNIKPAGSINIDGDTSDWNLSEFTSLVRAGDVLAGDVALVGYDGGTLYWAGRGTRLGLPRNALDHTARVYARHDASHLYFLVRLDDDQIQTQHGTAMNWANDSVEFYIDPSGNGGSSPMKSSTSDIQLVIDAANQRNVYMTTDSYKTEILNGVTSAVSIDSTGWWLEVGIETAVLDPDLPMSGTFGLDFNFRDNDENNNPTESSVYTWSDTEESGTFPSKIPNRWGQGNLVPLLP